MRLLFFSNHLLITKNEVRLFRNKDRYKNWHPLARGFLKWPPKKRNESRDILSGKGNQSLRPKHDTMHPPPSAGPRPRAWYWIALAGSRSMVAMYCPSVCATRSCFCVTVWLPAGPRTPSAPGVPRGAPGPRSVAKGRHGRNDTVNLSLTSELGISAKKKQVNGRYKGLADVFRPKTQDSSAGRIPHPPAIPHPFPPPVGGRGAPGSDGHAGEDAGDDLADGALGHNEDHDGLAAQHHVRRHPLRPHHELHPPRWRQPPPQPGGGADRGDGRTDETPRATLCPVCGGGGPKERVWRWCAAPDSGSGLARGAYRSVRSGDPVPARGLEEGDRPESGCVFGVSGCVCGVCRGWGWPRSPSGKRRCPLSRRRPPRPRATAPGARPTASSPSGPSLGGEGARPVMTRGRRRNAWRGCGRGMCPWCGGGLGGHAFG